MWNEKFLKVIPAVMFLFCILQIFELVLIVNNMNESEKIEVRIRNDLKVLKNIMSSLNESSEGMQLSERFKDKKIKIK
ncbi:hypothetical protein KVJ86_00995 [Helicobacter pylori]|nr:hypothetical protein KVJ86_00995 [Helicobacter pylori]